MSEELRHVLRTLKRYAEPERGLAHPVTWLHEPDSGEIFGAFLTLDAMKYVRTGDETTDEQWDPMDHGHLEHDDWDDGDDDSEDWLWGNEEWKRKQVSQEIQRALDRGVARVDIELVLRDMPPPDWSDARRVANCARRLADLPGQAPAEPHE